MSGIHAKIDDFFTTVGASNVSLTVNQSTVGQTATPTIGVLTKEAEKEEEPMVISLAVPDIIGVLTKEAEKEEEPAVISLAVPDTSSDYLRTTWNSVTGYETSV